LSTAIDAVTDWLNNVVIELNLCPFAKREVLSNRVRFSLSEANSEKQLLGDLAFELQYLCNHDTVETTLLIHPSVLQDFADYNQFLDLADVLINQLNLRGELQIASFHPDYQFAGTQSDDAENYSNRSPLPLLHILREASLENAIEQHPDTEQIPARNIALLNQIGQQELSRRLQKCNGG
jgi:hypothetical protein